MKLSDGEKLILVMLADIYEHLGIKREVDPDLVKSAIFGGDLWALKWQYCDHFSPSVPEEVVNETADILTMWRMVEAAYEELSKPEKDAVRKAVDPRGVTFDGFDGNDSKGHYGVATFLVEKLGRFAELKGRNLNSHTSYSLEHYRGMLAAYEQVRDSKNQHDWFKFTPDELIAILKG